MRKLLLALTFLLPSVALGAQISVPSALGGGYYLVSSSTGAYVASSTSVLNIGSLFASTTSATSTFSGAIATGAFAITGTTGCLQASASGGYVTGTGSNCGSGSGGGNWFTSNGAYNSTTTPIGFLTGGIFVNAASSTFTGGTGLATTTFNTGVQITATGNTSNSVSIGGLVNINNTSNAGPGLEVYNNHGASAGGRSVVVNCDNTAFDQTCLYVRSQSQTVTAVNIQGAANGQGTLKLDIGSGGNVGNANSALLSFDTTDHTFYGQGIFGKCNGSTTSPCIQLVDNTSTLLFKVDGNGLITTNLATGFVQSTSGALSSAALTSGNITTALGFTPFGGTNPLPVANGGTASTTLSGILKGNATSQVGTAVNGTDYTLISALSCSAGQHLNSITAAGALTCSADTGAGGSGLATTTPLSSGNLLAYSASGAGFAIGVATSTFALSGATLVTTGTLGSLVGGAASTIALNLASANNWIALQNFYSNASTSQFTATSTTWLATSAGGLVVGTTTSPARAAFITGSNSGGPFEVARNAGNALFSSFYGNVVNTLFEATSTRNVASSTGPCQIFRAATSSLATGFDAGSPIFADFCGIQDGSTNSDYSGGFVARTYLSGTPSVRFLIDSSGRTGIGSTSPAFTLSVLGNTYLSATTTIGTDNNAYLQVGNKPPLYGYLANDRANFRDNRNDYSAVNEENDSSGACATADFTTANDLATNSTYFGDLGHTSSGFTGAGCANNPFTGYGPNDTYLFDPNGNINFSLGSTSDASFRWFAGGYATVNRKMTLTNGGNLGIGSTTPYATLSVVGKSDLGTSALAGFFTATTTTATSTFAGAVQIGATSGSNALKITAAATSTNSITTGGVVNIRQPFDGVALGVYKTGSASDGGRGIFFNQDSVTDVQDFILASSSCANCTAFNIKGAPTGKGVLKIEHTGGLTGYSNASAISIDLLNCADCQGIFIDRTGGAGTGNILTLKDNGTARLVLTPGGNLGIGTSTPGTPLSIGATGAGINLGTGTSTYTGLGGINLVTGAGTAGCFAINGICVGNVSGTNFFTNSTVSTYLSTGFNLGIGTTTPYAPLSVSTTTQGLGSVPLFVVASTTNAQLFSVLGNGRVSIPTELTIPNGSTQPTQKTAGDIFAQTNTASSSIEWYDGTNWFAAYDTFDKPTIYASSSLAYDGAYGATGTTTYKDVWNPSQAVTSTQIYCKTDKGTAIYTVGNGAATSTVTCTTTGAVNVASVAFTLRQSVVEAVGSQTGNPNQITVTPTFRYTSY